MCAVREDLARTRDVKSRGWLRIHGCLYFGNISRRRMSVEMREFAGIPLPILHLFMCVFFCSRLFFCVSVCIKHTFAKRVYLLNAFIYLFGFFRVMN